MLKELLTIEKPGKLEKRPLGIPVIKDRVVQMAMKLIIEPIFESNFLDCSHGFRPGRSAHDAIRIIDRLSRIPGTLVRYADDFVILLWRDGKKVLNQIKQMLERLGLKVHPDKTRVVEANQGFDFLGVHFRLCPTRSKKAKLKEFCALWPSDSSMKRIRQSIRLDRE